MIGGETLKQENNGISLNDMNLHVYVRIRVRHAFPFHVRISEST